MTDRTDAVKESRKGGLSQVPFKPKAEGHQRPAERQTRTKHSTILTVPFSSSARLDREQAHIFLAHPPAQAKGFLADRRAHTGVRSLFGVHTYCIIFAMTSA